MPGKYFEDLEVGQEFHHALGRTVTEMAHSGCWPHGQWFTQERHQSRDDIHDNWSKPT